MSAAAVSVVVVIFCTALVNTFAVSEVEQRVSKTFKQQGERQSGFLALLRCCNVPTKQVPLTVRRSFHVRNIFFAKERSKILGGRAQECKCPLRANHIDQLVGTANAP